MSGRCSSRPLATLTTCNGDLDADTHGVILSPAVPSPPPLPLSPPPNYTRENGLWPAAALSPHPYPCQPRPLGFPHASMLHASLTPQRTPPHARGPLGTPTHRLACARVSPSPGLILTWQIAVVLCARLLVATQSLLPVLLSSILLVFPTAQQLACVSLLVCGRTTATLPVLVGVMMIGQCVRINTCATLASWKGPDPAAL